MYTLLPNSSFNAPKLVNLLGGGGVDHLDPTLPEAVHVGADTVRAARHTGQGQHLVVCARALAGDGAVVLPVLDANAFVGRRFPELPVGPSWQDTPMTAIVSRRSFADYAKSKEDRP